MQGTEMFATFIGSVALLLWGVRMVRTGMTRAFGAALRQALSTSTKTSLRAFLAGLGVTGLLQSSTATVLLLASFATRNFIALPIALVMMLGANVGTSLTAQLFSFDITWLWSLCVALGVGVFVSTSGERHHAIGRIAIGLGLMMLSLIQLHAAATPLEHSASFAALLSGLAGDPILACVAATALTWLMHSSLTMVLFVMTLAAAKALPVPLALAMVLGANIGGALAPFSALIGAAPAARRLVLGNLLQRVAVAVPLLFLLSPALDLLRTMSTDPHRLVLNFHTAFNVVAALLLLPLTSPVATLVIRLMPDPRPDLDGAQPRHLDPNAVDNPSEALACAMRETLHLGDRVSDMLGGFPAALQGNDLKAVRELEKADNIVDALHEAIKLYLVKASQADMNEEENRRYLEILAFTTNLEHVGDIIDKNLMELAAKKIKNRYTFSPQGYDEIRDFHGLVMDNMRLALNVFATRDIGLARRLFAEKTAARNAETAAADSHFARLRAGRTDSIETSAIHLDVIRDLKRVNGHLISAAYPILEAAGELRDSRLRIPEDEPDGRDRADSLKLASMTAGSAPVRSQ